MSLKDSLVNKLEQQMDAWEKQVDAMRAKADERVADAENEKASAQIQADFAQGIDRLEGYIGDARKRLDELREAGESHLDDLRKQIDGWLDSDGDAGEETKTQEKSQTSSQ